MAAPVDPDQKEVVQPEEQLKTPDSAEKLKKRKPLSEERPRSSASTEGDAVTSAEADNADNKSESGKLLKKHKKEKPKKLKGDKRKKKKSVEGKAEASAEDEVASNEASPGKAGKKRKMSEGEDSNKGKKKKKKKNQPEVVVRPWSDLEGEDEAEVCFSLRSFYLTSFICSYVWEKLSVSSLTSPLVKKLAA